VALPVEDDLQVAASPVPWRTTSRVQGVRTRTGPMCASEVRAPSAEEAVGPSVSAARGMAGEGSRWPARLTGFEPKCLEPEGYGGYRYIHTYIVVVWIERMMS
jgi:hypothetical protein